MSLAQLAGSSIASAAATAVLAAGFAATLVLVLAARPWRGRAAATARWGPPLALSTAFAVGYVLVLGAPEFPPERARAWLFFAALAMGALGVSDGLGRPLPFLVWGLAWTLPWVLLDFQRANHWGRLEGFLSTNGLALWGVVALWASSAHERRTPSARAAFGLAFALALSAGAYGLAGSAGTAQLTGVLALAVGLCALLGAWRSSAGLGTAGSVVAVPLHFGLLWSARYLAELHDTSFVLLSLVPLSAWAALAIPAARPRTRTLVATLAPVLLAGLALAIEFRGAPAPSPYG